MITSRTKKEQLLMQSSIYGALRGLISLPLEHPFESIKTRAQSSISFRSSIEVLKEMQGFGLRKGIYAGFLPNSFRVTIKHFYRTPLMLFFPQVFEKRLPKKMLENFPCAHKTCSGGIIAFIETFIICPIERMMVMLMTKENEILFQKELVESNYKKLFNVLFTGLKATLIKQCVSWTSFLYFDFKYKSIFREYRGITKSTPLNYSDLTIVAVLTGMTNIALGTSILISVLPFDKVKILYQSHKNEKFRNKSLSNIFMSTYKNGGISSFYSGWQPRLAQYIFQALFTCSLIDHFEAKLKREF